MRKRTIAALVLAPLAAAIVACSAIVSNEVPEFKCAGTGPSDCPPGTVCDLGSGHCIVDLGDGGGGDEGVPVDEGGDGTPDDAADTGPIIGQLGDPCATGADCASAICGTSTLLGATATVGGPVCTETCCKSEDCPSGFVCFGAGTGGSYCVRAANAQRSPPASGGKIAGSTCIGDSECRSGLCASGGRCLDTCCVQTDCATGTVCAVATVDKHDLWVCADPAKWGGVRNLGTSCTAQTQCKNDNCVASDGTANPQQCTPSCCSAQSCDGQGFTGYHCAYGTSGTDQLKWCITTGGATPLGMSCQQNLECASTYCDPELKKCMTPCCKDSDCGINEVCHPSALSTPFLRCVPKPR